jgi:hypothetical protein
MKAIKRALTGALVLAIAGGGLLLGATSASAATPPPFEPDANSLGSLAFYDASGNVVTSGTDLAHIFDYAVAATPAARTGTTKATAFFGFPDHTQPDSQTWFSTQATAAATFPNAAAPAPINGFGRRPVSQAGPTEATLSAILGTTTLDQTPGYVNIVQIRVRDSGPGIGNGFLAKFWAADIQFNIAANTWTQVFPSVAAAPTTTALAATPTSAQEPGVAVGLTATVSPSSAAGTVQFKDGATDLGSPVTVAAGAASATTTALSVGSHSVTGVFTPTDPAAFAPSTSAAKTYLIANKPAPPTGVTATAGNAAATVSWTAPASDPNAPIIGYDVQYSANGGPFTAVGPNFHTSTLTSHVVTGLTNGTPYVFQVAAINAVGTGASSAASSPAVTPVADASTLAIAGPSTVRYGAKALITAKLTDSSTHAAIGSAPVVLYRRAGSSKPWSGVKTLTTSSTGAASLAVALTANTQFQWRYAGVPTHKAVTSATRSVTASQVVSVARSASSVKHGASVRIYGTVSPSGRGQVVTLQRLVSGHWRSLTVRATIKSQRLPNGRVAVGYVLSVKLTTRGSYTLRVYKPATSTLAAGYSGSTAVRAT